jgi:hypothetical protein
MRSWLPDPSLFAWSALHRLSYFAGHPIHPSGQLCLAFSDPDHRDTWATPHGDRAFTLGPALTHYRCQRVYVVSSRSERITLTLAHFPRPLFHFAASDLPPPPTPDPSATRPSPTLDGMDLIGRVFNDPDRVVEVGPPHRLAPGEGNLDPIGSHLQAGWVPTLRYTSLGGSKPWRPLTFPYPHLYYPPPPFRHTHHDAVKGPSPPHSPLSHLPHCIRPAIRGPHGKESTIEDE